MFGLIWLPDKISLRPCEARRTERSRVFACRASASHPGLDARRICLLRDSAGGAAKVRDGSYRIGPEDSAPEPEGSRQV